MKLSGYLCDGGCGASGQSKAHESSPDGWILVFPGSGQLHFCGWSCLRIYATDRGLPAEARNNGAL